MSVMNRAGPDSCRYQGDEICPLYHFLEKMDGEEEVRCRGGGMVWATSLGRCGGQEQGRARPTVHSLRDDEYTPGARYWHSGKKKRGGGIS